MESSILKATGVELDLSEENMKNLLSRYSAYGFDMNTNYGGYMKMAYGCLASWIGPVSESEDKYKMNGVLSPLLNSLAHVQNILFLKRENYTDNDEIKMAIMKYGGVSTSLYSSGQKYQYYTGSNNQNHEAVIV